MKIKSTKSLQYKSLSFCFLMVLILAAGGCSKKTDTADVKENSVQDQIASSTSESSIEANNKEQGVDSEAEGSDVGNSDSNSITGEGITVSKSALEENTEKGTQQTEIEQAPNNNISTETQNTADQNKTPNTDKNTSDKDKTPNTDKNTSDKDKTPNTGQNTSDKDKTPNTGQNSSDKDKTPNTDKNTSDKDKTPNTDKNTSDKDKTPNTDKNTSDKDKTPNTDKETKPEKPEEDTKEPENTITLSDIHTAVKETLGEHYLPNMELTKDMFESKFGITSDLYEEFAAEEPMISANIDFFIAVKAKKGSGKKVEKLLEDYRKDYVENSLQYPANLAKVQASSILRYDDYVFFFTLGEQPPLDMDKEEERLEFAKKQNQKVTDIISGFFNKK